MQYAVLMLGMLQTCPNCHVFDEKGDDFFVSSAITKANNAAFARDALLFQITEDIPATGDTKRMGCAGPMPGTLRPSLPWTVQLVGSPERATR
jgi:hypothetical protein